MPIAYLVITLVLWAGGCARLPSGVVPAEPNRGPQSADAALHDAQAEAMTLRADLAAARIAAAKQEAELRDLRRQVTELQQLVDAKHAELIALREERERLAPSATIAQVHVADPSAQSASAAEATRIEAKLHALEATLATLTAELAQLKQAMPQSVVEATR